MLLPSCCDVAALQSWWLAGEQNMMYVARSKNKKVVYGLRACTLRVHQGRFVENTLFHTKKTVAYQWVSAFVFCDAASPNQADGDPPRCWGVLQGSGETLVGRPPKGLRVKCQLAD